MHVLGIIYGIGQSFSLDFVETAHARPSENKFSWCSLNRSLDFVDFVELFHVRHCSNEFGSVLT